MSATLAQISFEELLAANETETQKWRKWFDEQPASALEIPLSIALAKNVREFLLHIFAVELGYAERLHGLRSRLTSRYRPVVLRRCLALATKRQACIASILRRRPTRTLRA